MYQLLSLSPLTLVSEPSGDRFPFQSEPIFAAICQVTDKVILYWPISLKLLLFLQTY